MNLFGKAAVAIVAIIGVPGVLYGLSYLGPMTVLVARQAKGIESTYDCQGELSTWANLERYAMVPIEDHQTALFYAKAYARVLAACQNTPFQEGKAFHAYPAIAALARSDEVQALVAGKK